MIREKRIEKRLAEETLAEICDISDREIRNIESGRVIPKFNTALKLATAFDINIGELGDLVKRKEEVYV